MLGLSQRTGADMTSTRSQLAIDFIKDCCPHVGAFHGTTAVHAYVHDTAAEMATTPASAAFPERYIEHVAYAMQVVATNDFTSPPAAVASVYLATRFEYYFRVLSRRLNADGTWVSPSDQVAVNAQITDPRLGRARISSVSLAYKIMKLDASRPLPQCCADLDAMLYHCPTAAGGKTIADLGDRIEFGRHAVGHGHWGDMSAEALFYGLTTALVFYNQA
jgi:hypothetical protein